MEIPTYNSKKIEVSLDVDLANNNLIALPALIDPHVHFRTPGAEHKEDWITGSSAAFAGGVTTVIDMPNNNPPAIDYVSLISKKKIIDDQITQSGRPLKYYLYLGATPTNWTEFEKCHDEVIGIKLFMGASTGNLLVDKLTDQEKIFAEAARLNMLVAVHAEDEEIIKAKSQQFIANSVNDHSKIRSRSAAVKAVSQAIALAEKYGTRLYVCHVSTADEIEIIKSAKARGVKVFAEVTPHHLFLNQNAYESLGALAQMNPPLRTPEDQNALWQAINEGIIDTIGTDHAPHTLEEKAKPYPTSPSGVPNIENYLALLLNAAGQSLARRSYAGNTKNNNKITLDNQPNNNYNIGAKAAKISLEKIVELTHDNPQKIFNLPKNDDWVVVDLDKEKTIKNEDQKTKCGWSPYAGMKLKGWPIKINQRLKI
ncbi:MAG: amidohydrolase family protein [Candidatus Magasanikbacteria bacterium]